MVGSERRILERISTRIEVQMRIVFAHDMNNDGESFPALMLDFNASGARIATAANGQGRALQERLTHESAMAICEVGVADSPLYLRLCGQVRWAHLNGQRRDLEVGLRFFGGSDVRALQLLTEGKSLTRAPAARLPWIALSFMLLLGSAWFYLDGTTKATELAQAREALNDSAQRRDLLTKRLRDSEARVQALESEATLADRE